MGLYIIFLIVFFRQKNDSRFFLLLEDLQKKQNNKGYLEGNFQGKGDSFKLLKLIKKKALGNDLISINVQTMCNGES